MIRLAQLLAAGLDHNAITRRVKDGRLHRLYHGVYAVGHPGLSYEGRVIASVFACGDDAAAGRLTAGSLLKVSRFPRPSLDDVVVPRQRRQSRINVRRSSTLRPEDVTTHKRIPITKFARLVVDLDDTLTPHQLANVLHKGAYRKLFIEAQIRDQIERARRTKTTERALSLYLGGSCGTRSGAEDAFLRLTEIEPLVNTKLLNEEVDFHWPDRRLIVEVDGQHHGRTTTQQDDARRDAKLAEAGFTVIRFSDEAVYSGLNGLARECTPEQRAQLGPLLHR